MNEKLMPIFESVISGNDDAARERVQNALNDGISAEDILKQGLIPAMEEVGNLFESGDCFVPEMLMAARAMQAGLEILKPLLTAADVKSAGVIVIGTVQGDLHDIGKNLVGMMLEGAGFELIDLGTNVQPEKFIEVVRDKKVDIVAMSALLTTTTFSMEKVIEALKDAGLRDKIKVLVGGAPVTEDYAQKIGADGYAPDASRAVYMAKKMLG